MITEGEALTAVARIAGSVKFVPSGDIERTEIARTLMGMVNWPKSRVVRIVVTDSNGNTTEDPMPYVEPSHRLERLVRAMTAHVREWPGVAGLRSVYDKMYASADGVKPGYCDVPGFSDEEEESGTDVISLDRGRVMQQAPYQIQAGDESIDQKFKTQFKQTVATVKGGK